MSPQANADPAFQHGVVTANPTALLSNSTSTSISSLPATNVSQTSLSSTQTTSSTITTSEQSATTTTNAPIPEILAPSSSDASSSSGSIYVYNPSVAGAAAFTVLYFLVMIYHFYLSIYIPHIRKSVTNKHKYTIPLFVAAALLTLGFSVRIVSVASESGGASIGLFSLSTCAIIIAPIFMCASLYLMVAHLIRLCLPHGSEQNFLGLSPQSLGGIFIGSDVLSFLLQGAGSAIATSGNWQGTRRAVGERVLIAGLAMQLGTFTLYMVILGLFCRKVSAGTNGKVGRDEFARRADCVSGGPEITRREFGFNPLVRQIMKGMWIASFLIEIHSIYRTIEFGTGANGYLFRHEWSLWVLEALPVWIALLVLGIYHPTTWLQQKRKSAFLHDK